MPTIRRILNIVRLPHFSASNSNRQYPYTRDRDENSLIPPYKNLVAPCRDCRGGLAGNDTSADIFAMLAGNVVS